MAEHEITAIDWSIPPYECQDERWIWKPGLVYLLWPTPIDHLLVGWPSEEPVGGGSRVRRRR
jgi:hypothetical protein